MSAKSYEATLELNQLWLPDGIYWPFERLPESKLETYATACVETALKYSEDARIIYAGIVRSWDLPGCQAFLNNAGLHKQDTKAWLTDRLRAAVANKPLPDWPDAWKAAIAKVKDDTDFHKLLKYVGYFILAAFNRKADIDNQTLRVLPVKAPYLAQAVVSCSTNHYLEMKPELKQSWPKVISDNELTDITLLCHILGSDPTTGMSRQVKRQIVRTLRRKDFKLRHYSKILEDAEKWYKCRVCPGTIEEYLNEAAPLSKTGLERSNVETAIAPYDQATGYPRKWRR